MSLFNIWKHRESQIMMVQLMWYFQIYDGVIFIQKKLCFTFWISIFSKANDKQQASLIAHMVKNPPAMQETPVQFLGQEDPLEKG